MHRHLPVHKIPHICIRLVWFTNGAPLLCQAALAALPTGEADQRRAALEQRIAQHSAQVGEERSFEHIDSCAALCGPPDGRT